MLGLLTMKLCTLIYFGGEDNDKESEAINTCYFLYGHCAPMHVHAVKKERRKVNKKDNGMMVTSSN